MSRAVGLAAALGAAAAFGLVNVAAKRAVEDIPPLHASAIAYGFAAFALIPLLPRARIERVDVPRAAVMVVAGAIVAPLLLFTGLSSTPATTASLLMTLEMVFTGGLAALFLGERVTRREALGLVALFGAAIAVAWGGGPEGFGLGAFFVAGAALAWSLDNVASTPLARRYDPRALIALKGLSGSVALGAASLMVGGLALPPLENLLLLAFVGIVGIGYSGVLYYAALKRAGATLTATVFSTSALLGALFGWLLLGESPTRGHAVAAMLIVVGILLLARRG